MFANCIQDFRYSLRQFRKSPGFAFTAIAVLALGLGANVAVFTLIDGILLRSLPYAHPDRLVAINAPSANGFTMLLNYSNLKQLSDAMGSRTQTGVMLDQSRASVVGPGGRLQVEQETVSSDLMTVLGAQPQIGRSFRPEENEPGREHVLLIGDDVWRRLFNQDPQVVGKSLLVKGRSYTIIGVMPKEFSFPFGGEKQVWSPATIGPQARSAMAGPKQVWGTLFARLPEGVTAASLEADLNRVQAQIAKEVPDSEIPLKLEVTNYQQSLNHQARKPLLLLYMVVFGIWALACLNVTSLMLVRAIGRSREMAVRSALGASRSRLLQQSIVESLLLSIAGSVLGLLTGQLVLKVLWHQIERNLPLTNEVHLEWRVVVSLIMLTCITALLTGIVPALRAARRSVQEDLHGVNSTASASHTRMREGLVIAQLALTLVFLVGAGLFLRTISALRQVPLGFGQQNVLTGGVIVNPTMDAADSDEESAHGLNLVQSAYLPLLDRLRAIPGVRVAALSSVLPMRSEFAVSLAMTLDHKKTAYAQNPTADGRLATAGLVDALGIPMMRGRFFAEEDSSTAPVVVVINEAFANKYFAGQNPVGHTVSMGKGRFADARIVGVIANMKQTDVTKPTKPEMYFCLAQIEPGTPLYGIAKAFMQVAIRASVPADALRAQFDKALHDVAPDATTTDVETIHEAVEDSFGSQTLTSRLLEGFALLALVIASVGLYGLLSFTVAQRTREIAVRFALGAQQASILQMVLRRAQVLMVAGLACGTTLAWFAVKLTQGYIYGVQSHDAATFASVIGVLAAACFVAAWMPARHAAAIEPVVALRSE
ncbi:ABC transporter permease [Acidicapsa dinghuensis]|uniref:ABC transporter permease n=1 Tax=Acidicapsa dinghuensis TaxID=2218256 RepID=A0ABW1EG14_9BACT|nr:ABC transporter permease [Acidicapsa dinghuensis]